MPRLVLHEVARYANVAPLDVPDLSHRVRMMLINDELIRTTHKQEIFKDPDLIYCEVAAGLPLFELMYQEGVSPLSRDDRLLLQQKIEQSVPVEPGVVAASSPVGSLGLYSAGAAYELNSATDWMLFVRGDIRASPGSASYFHLQCGMAFPNLHFGTSFPGCLDTMTGGHGAYAAAVVDCFGALNDEWFKCFDGGFIVDALEKLQAIANYPASMEGNGDRKKQLTFNFIKGARTMSLVCEPHLKIRSPDQAGDSARTNERIYFCPRSVEEFPGIVFVGHAGEHL